MSKKYFFYEVTPSSWNEAKEIGKGLGFCVFRGQADNEWNLSTSLERASEQYSFPSEGLWDQEQRILYEFKSRAHQFIANLPKENEYIEWLSLVQHYGGPTRLLDFTKSFYIAAFFAMERATKTSCVWAIDEIFLKTNVLKEKKIKLDSEKAYPLNLEPILRFAETVIENSRFRSNLVVPVVPPRLNERLAVQRGLFLFPCNISSPFEENLCSTFTFPFQQLKSNYAIQLAPSDVTEDVIKFTEVMKINLSRSWHRDAMYDLDSMNIDAASLFPGLDGFARSLKLLMRASDQKNK